jgi:ribose transport system ATP-binding protein
VSAFLEVDRVSKSYPGVRALQGVSVIAGRNEVVGIVGENGAGKSTLMDIVSGVQQADEGEVRLTGERLRTHGYHQAAERGVFRIFQHQALVPNLRVCENMFLTHERHFRTAGVLRLGRMADAAREVLEETGHERIDPLATTSSYDFATRQIIEVVKALALSRVLEIEHPVILLDEPTSALSSEEVEFFSRFVRSLRERASLVFVSHRLPEILELCDRCYVLKDGRNVKSLDTLQGVTEGDLHELMVGRQRDEAFYREDAQRPGEDDVALRVRDLSLGAAFNGVSFDLHRGEVLGIAGVIGSGKTELGRAIFEGDRHATGTVEVDGAEVRGGGPARMIRRRVGYVPPERLADGVIGVAPIAWNVSLPEQATQGRTGLLDLRRERREAGEVYERLRVRAPNVDTRVETLSGGNQQKVVIGKWLANDSRVLILDNPTNGVDVGAKSEIYGLIRELCAQGIAVLLISDDLLELIGLSHRILVMKDGRVTDEVPAPPDGKPSEQELVAEMV